MVAEMHARTRRIAVAAAGLALTLAGGCVGFERILEPGGLSGLEVQKQNEPILEEPAIPPEASTYVSANAYRTIGAPVRLNVSDREALFTVNSVRMDLFRSPYVVASFLGGAILEREFGKVLEANFRSPVGGEAPVAELGVRIAWVKTAQTSDSEPISVSMRLNVEIVKADESTPVWKKSIDATESAAWKNRSQVPEAFYAALFDAIRQFIADWDRGGGPDAVARWAGEAVPGVVPPELRKIAWEAGAERSGLQRGRCVVACNGFEGFRAKHWANGQISVACRTKLGINDPGLLRVVYDTEDYDPVAGTWAFAFRCFARCERVLDYNATTGMGTVIGDRGLMKMEPEEAAEALKAYVHREMDSHAGRVDSEHRTTRAQLRFDDYRTDQAYDLIIIDFHMLR